MNIDLHTHTTASDGALSPGELIAAAVERRIPMLAITDHDSIAAFSQLDSETESPRLITGIELSTVWRRMGIHIVGLNFRLDSPAIGEAVRCQDRARTERGERIAEKLEKLGVDNPLGGAMAIAGDSTLGRPHFARHMVNVGFVRTEEEAFRKYLGSGKGCDINNNWASLPQVVCWIREAGGSAVLAHPGRYNLTRTRLASLVEEFVAAGGEALEVVSGRQLPTQTRDFARLATAHGLLMSCGSDFHQPGQSWAQLGCYSTPPPALIPVWDRW